MKNFLTWMARGGIAIALVLLVVSVWPSTVVTQSQEFEIPAGETLPAVIRFNAPETVHRGEQVDFLVSLDLSSLPAVDEDVHPVMVYRLELAGAEIFPDAVYQIPLSGVQHQETGWTVRLPQSGDFVGTWWVYLEIVSTSGDTIDRQALFAKPFQVQSRGILGMSVNFVRWLSIILMLVGVGCEVWGIVRKSK